MSDNIETFDESGAGSSRPFILKYHTDDVAVIVEYLERDAEHRDPKYPQNARKAVKANITAFGSQEDLDNGTAQEFPNAWIKSAYVYKQVEDEPEGKVLIRKVVQLPAKDGGQPTFALFGLDSKATFDKALEFYRNREANLAKVKESGALPWDDDEDED